MFICNSLHRYGSILGVNTFTMEFLTTFIQSPFRFNENLMNVDKYTLHSILLILLKMHYINIKLAVINCHCKCLSHILLRFIGKAENKM